MKKKLLGFILSVCLTIPCAFMLTACVPTEEGETDINLYHLTISYSSNVKLNEKFKQEDLKAIYYNKEEYRTTLPESPTARDTDEVEELLQAGATQEVIDKAGVRQADGSYYFFDGDPMYLDAPKVDGYIFLGFFDNSKGDSQTPFRKNLTDIDHKQALPRWNMDNKNVILEARYEAISYDVIYKLKEDDAPLITDLGDHNNDSNPSSFDYLENPQVALLAPKNDIANKEFTGWYYEVIETDPNDITKNIRVKYEINDQNPYLPIDEDKLPVNDWLFDGTGKKELVIFANYEYPKHEVKIDYELLGETSFDISTVCESVVMIGSATNTVDGELTLDEPLTVNSNSEIFAKEGENGWFYILITAKEGYRISSITINENPIQVVSWPGNISIPENENIKYINQEDIKTDLNIVITFEAEV